jgi:RNA polymerase sigma-70 factor (ECF subfamily)
MIPVSKELVKRCIEADRTTQKELFNRLYGSMYRVCFRYLGNQAEAEDCMMKGFMKAFQSLGKFDYQGDHSFFAWIRRIMVNESLMELRRKSRLMLVPQEEGEHMADSSDVLEMLSAEQLYKLVTDLPDGYRTVFNLYVIEGYAHQEIAAMLGISENTSRTQLAKARTKLKTTIERLYEINGTHGR